MDDKTRRLDDEALDLTALLHPARAFAKPMDVVNDLDLTLSEKRAILAAWASDACAVEANPSLRSASGRSSVQFDEIMDALHELDRIAAEKQAAAALSARARKTQRTAASALFR